MRASLKINIAEQSLSSLMTCPSKTYEYFSTFEAFSQKWRDKRVIPVRFMRENVMTSCSSNDLLMAIRYYQRCFDHSPADFVYFEYCLQIGRRIPIDAAIGFELLKKTVDSDRINNFGYCFEQSQDIDQDIDHAI
jgi:hypothetical protein